ncbi:MAG: 4Fe-4S binding protein, partial [Candidatus Abyssubacteria bacterium]|nr:4Fe-4S binding protein [Candidatus Abyssubacteria bacterium]
IVIARGECSLQSNRRSRYVPPRFDDSYSIIRERCQRCGLCYKDFGCPAIIETGDEEGEFYYIDEETCVRCGACKTVCPNSAIVHSRIRPAGTESLLEAASGGEG